MKNTTKLRIPTRRAPTTVGEMLLEEYIKPLGVTQGEFADALKIDRPALNAIINGRRSLSVGMAVRLGRVLGTTSQLWLNLQMLSDLYAFTHSAEGKKIAALRVFKPLSKPRVRELVTH